MKINKSADSKPDRQERDRAGIAAEQWQHEFPDWDLLPMEVLGRLAETAAVIGRDHVAPVLAQFDLQAGEFDVLAALRRSGAPFEMTPSDLFGITMLSSGGMTARLDRLEKRRLIERRPNPDDRRGVLVRLTLSGQEQVEAALPVHRQRQADLTACLPRESLAELAELLQVLLQHASDSHRVSGDEART